MSSEPAPPPVRTPRRGRAVMWLAMLALLATVGVAVGVGAQPAALLLAGVLVVLAAVRALLPAPGPYGIATRGKLFDVAVLVAAAAVIAFLALTIPGDAVS